MTSYELRLIDEAISHILRGDYYNADLADVETFQNDLRRHIVGRIKIEDTEQRITITFPQTIALTKPISENKKYDQWSINQDIVMGAQVLRVIGFRKT
jgi:hypothetical protein